MVTLDGIAYDFHAAGEFVLLRATNGADFEVQARMTPVTGSDSLTVNSAIAARVGNSNIMIDSADANPFSVDGVATEIPNFDSIMIGNDEVFRANNVYTIVLAGADDTVTGGDSQIKITVLDGRVDMVMSLDYELAGNLEGLLGDADATPPMMLPLQMARPCCARLHSKTSTVPIVTIGASAQQTTASLPMTPAKRSKASICLVARRRSHPSATSPTKKSPPQQQSSLRPD